MALEEIDKELDSVDNILTKLTKILKKHWIILIALSALALGYYIVTFEDTTSETNTEQTVE